MATVRTTEGAADYSEFKPSGRNVAFAGGTYEITSALSKSDIIAFCRLPACEVVDGLLVGDDLDTGTEALEIDIGYSGSTSAFLNSGVLSGDAVTNFTQGAIIYQPLWQLLAAGTVTLTDNTEIIGTVVAAAASGGTGTLSLKLYYIE